MHCDLKFENCRFEKKENYDTVKLYDFGSAKLFKPGKLYYELSGSPYYMAPEMAAGDGYNEKCDVWSLGVIFYYLLAGAFPYDEVHDLDVLHSLQRMPVNYQGKRFKKIDRTAIDLMKRMLDKNPESRWTAEQVRKHPYFTYDELERKMIRNSLIQIKNFLRWGPIQRCFIRLYADKLLP